MRYNEDSVEIKKLSDEKNDLVDFYITNTWDYHFETVASKDDILQ